MTKTLERYGACFYLSLTGDPATIKDEAYRLYNFGIVADLPYDEDGKDKELPETITLLTDMGRLQRGYFAIGIVQMQMNSTERAKFKGKKGGFAEAAQAFATVAIAEYEKQQSVYENPQMGGYIFQQGRINSNARDRKDD